MSKYIYYDTKLRCKITKATMIGEFKLQLQKKTFLFWFDCFKWMVYEQREPHTILGYPLMNPIKMSYQFGNPYECWDEGTMTLKKRVKILFGEYFEEAKTIRQWDKKFDSIIE